MYGRSRLSLLLSLLALLLAWHPARADGIVIERQVQHYVVEADGTFAFTVDEVRKVASPSGLRDASRYAFGVDPGRQQLLALQAYTLKPDGRQVRAGPVQQQDRRTQRIRFANVASGDRLALRYTIASRRPVFPGHFEGLATLPSWPVRELRVIVDMPLAVPLYADAVGFVQVAPTDAPPPGRRRYQWRAIISSRGSSSSGHAGTRIERNAVDAADYGPRLAVSTFANYPAFAAAFRRALADRAQPSPDIAALAARLTEGLPDPHARALALADWVRRNVRYVDDYPGADDVAPRAAADVLATGHGDCKDHAVLLGALLDAAGIASTPALVNGGAAYRLPDVPTLALFNHMITYVPALDLYLDTADAAQPSGRLPAAVLGKPALLLQTGRFAMTPLLQPNKVASAETVDVARIDRTGGRTGRTQVATAHASNSVAASIAYMTQEAERRLDYVCPAVDAEDATTLQLPAGARILALPPPVSVVHGGIFYKAAYQRRAADAGDAVVVTRRLTFRHGRPTCTPAEFRAMQPALARVQSDLRSRIVVAGK